MIELRKNKRKHHLRKKSNRLQVHDYFVLLILSIFFLNPIFTVQASIANQVTNFPSNGWPVRDPEELGIDTDTLERMHQRMSKDEIALDSIQIVTQHNT